MSQHDHEAADTGPIFTGDDDAADVPPSRAGSRRARRRRSGCLPILVVLVVAAVGGYFAVTRGIDAVRDQFSGEAAEDYPGPGSGAVTFQVVGGDSISTIGQNLEEQGVVASVEAFTDAAEANGQGSAIQEGFYRLKKEMTAEAAVDLLVSGRTEGTSYTFTPGKTVEEITQLLARDTGIPRREFTAALDDPSALGLPDDAEGNAEGYLFPGSYLIFPDSSAETILGDMVDRWRQEAKDLDLDAAAESLGYSTHQIMTVASLVQAEGSLLDEEGKSRIARVIYNRLEIDGNPSAGFLALDATVNFALGEDITRLTIPQIDSVADNPYNTYRNKGLPPGPIATPGTEALEAALAPADGPWFYYVTVNLRTGETKFATTPDEFSQLEAELDEYCDTQSDRC